MRNNINFRTQMELKQFMALANYITSFNLLDETKTNYYFKKIKLAKNVNPEEVKNTIYNGWNTERILRTSTQYFNNRDFSFALQWSYPQAYYSIYMLTSAYMKLNGQKTETHTGVIQLFGTYAKAGKYPKCISMHSSGTKKFPEFFHINKTEVANTLEFDPDSIISCENQICQFLNATRKEQLAKKRVDLVKQNKKPTSQGQKRWMKKRLNEGDWLEISDKIGVTNILHLLYRKRIKANYRGIDSFLFSNPKANLIQNSLIQIVEALNFIHEMYIRKMIGIGRYKSFIEEFSRGTNIEFLHERLAVIENEI